VKNYRALALVRPEPAAPKKKTGVLLRVAGLVAVVGVIAWVFSSSEGEASEGGSGGGGGSGDEPPPDPPSTDPDRRPGLVKAVEVSEVAEALA
jgi:hypothetical protein